jgi:predicted DNA-binding WGR domain protein
MPTYNVYVIELVGMPGQAPNDKWVYVGQSGKTPAERFDQHKAGGLLASRIVRKYGRRLLPALYRNIGPFDDRKAAERAEAALARDLRRRGYVVPGDHGRPVQTPRNKPQ